MKSHNEIIDLVLDALFCDENSNYVLKGGTALALCYKLDRVSEDIDLDAPGRDCEKNNRLFIALKELAAEYDYSLRIAKDTDTVKRALLHYGGEKPLKIELSLRRIEIPSSETTIINGIKVYTIDALCLMKTSAYLSRDTLRDLYDLTFILDKYYDALTSETLRTVQNAFEYKDLAQFDYLVKTQDDSLIDKDILLSRFLQAHERLGLTWEQDNNPVADR